MQSMPQIYPNGHLNPGMSFMPMPAYQGAQMSMFLPGQPPIFMPMPSMKPLNQPQAQALFDFAAVSLDSKHKLSKKKPDEKKNDSDQVIESKPQEEQKKEVPAKTQEAPKIQEPTPVKNENMPAPAKPAEEPPRKLSAKKDEPQEGAAESAHNEAEEEDFSKYPQERPAKIIYTREMILDFIERESAMENPEIDEQLEDLMRVIEGVPKSQGGFGGSSRPGQRRDHGGRPPKSNNFYDKPGQKSGKSYRSGPSDYGTGYKPYPDQKPAAVPGLARATMTPEERKRYDEIRNTETDIIGRGKLADEETILKRNINLSLFKLTGENLELVYKELMPSCQDAETCQTTVHMLIDKAWSQTKYTDIYAELCAKIGNSKFTWFDKMTPEQKKEAKEKYNDEEDPQKIYKSFVLNKIRKEFMQGFDSFKKTMASAEGNAEYSDEDKLAVYIKAKGKVLANMSFIAGLYQRKYLPHKVMRIISFQICVQFMADFTRDDNKDFKFSTSEVFLEAFFRIMETCGDMIESKEDKEDKARTKEKRAAVNHKADEWIAAMMKAVIGGKYQPDEIAAKLPENDKKDVHFVNLVFKFISALKDSKKIATRLSSLIENAVENRKNNWRNTNPVYKPQESERRGGDRDRGDRGDRDRGDRGDRDRGGNRRRDDDYRGGKSNKYEDGGYGGDVFYEKKTTSYESKNEAKAPKATDANFEIKTIFADNKNNEDFATYADLFNSDNTAINTCSPDAILSAYLKHFYNTSAKVADIRTGIALNIVRNFKVSESTFFPIYAEFVLRNIDEDLPYIKKVSGKILAWVIGKTDFDLNKLTWNLSEDPDDRDNQKYYLGEILDEAVKAAKDLALDEKTVDDISKYKVSKIDSIS